MKEFELVRATIEDWEQVRDVECSARSRLFLPLEDEQELREYLTESVVFFIVCGTQRAGTVAYKTPTDSSIYIDGLVILPEYRGRGIGRAVLAQLMTTLGNHTYTLVVHPQNIIALQLYLSLGFIPQSWKENYFGDGEPRMMLKKESVGHTQDIV